MGTLTRSVPVRAAASLTVSITRPPPTATSSVTPSSITRAASSAAWSSRPARPRASSGSTPAPRRPAAAALGELHRRPLTRPHAHACRGRRPASRSSGRQRGQAARAHVQQARDGDGALAHRQRSAAASRTAAAWSASSSISTQPLSGRGPDGPRHAVGRGQPDAPARTTRRRGSGAPSKPSSAARKRASTPPRAISMPTYSPTGSVHADLADGAQRARPGGGDLHRLVGQLPLEVDGDQRLGSGRGGRRAGSAAIHSAGANRSLLTTATPRARRRRWSAAPPAPSTSCSGRRSGGCGPRSTSSSGAR